MDGKILAHAIAQTRGEDLRVVYALLFKTNTFDLLSAKTKDLFNKRVDHFSYAVKDEVRKLEKIDDGEIQLQLIAHLTKLLELKGMRYDSIETIEWQCDHIMHASHDLLVKEEPEYAQFRNNTEELIYESIVHYQMQKLFITFEEKFQQFNEHDALAFTNELIGIITKQPDNQQQLILDQLQLEAPTGELLLAKMRQEGTVITCTVIIEYIGFSGYASVTSAIANSMTITGIALPFGVYTFAAALLSVVMSPIFLIPILLGSGGYFMAHQTKTLQKKLLPIGIVQLLLPVLSDRQRSIGTPDFEPLLNAWTQLANRYENYKVERHTQLQTLQQIETNMAGIQATIHDYEAQQTVQAKERLSVYQFIREEMFDIPTNEQSTLYKQLLTDIHMIEQDIQYLKEQQQKNKEQSGLWNTITATFDNTKIANTLRFQQKELERMHEALCNEVISSQPPILADPIVKYNGLDYECKRLKDAIDNEQYNFEQERSKHAVTQQALKLLDKQIKTMEKELYGLAHLN